MCLVYKLRNIINSGNLSLPCPLVPSSSEDTKLRPLSSIKSSSVKGTMSTADPAEIGTEDEGQETSLVQDVSLPLFLQIEKNFRRSFYCIPKFTG